MKWFEIRAETCKLLSSGLSNILSRPERIWPEIGRITNLEVTIKNDSTNWNEDLTQQVDWTSTLGESISRKWIRPLLMWITFEDIWAMVIKTDKREGKNWPYPLHDIWSLRKIVSTLNLCHSGVVVGQQIFSSRCFYLTPFNFWGAFFVWPLASSLYDTIHLGESISLTTAGDCAIAPHLSRPQQSGNPQISQTVTSGPRKLWWLNSKIWTWCDL